MGTYREKQTKRQKKVQCPLSGIIFQKVRWQFYVQIITVNSRFKKDLKLQIYLHKAFFSDDLFIDSLHKSFLNQTTLDLRKEKWTFLNREFTVLHILETDNIISWIFCANLHKTFFLIISSELYLLQIVNQNYLNVLDLTNYLKTIFSYKITLCWF